MFVRRPSLWRPVLLAVAALALGISAFLPHTNAGFTATTSSLANSWAAAASGVTNTPLTSLALDASTPAVANNNTSNAKTATTASFTPPSGALLMVNADFNFSAGNAATAITVSNSGAALTWTQVGWVDPSHSSGTDGGAYVAWATLATSRALTVSIAATTSTQTDGVSLAVEVITGANTSSPIGAVSAAADTAGTFAPTLTSTVANSWTWLLVSDWAAGATPTPAGKAILVSGGLYGPSGATATSAVLRADTTTAFAGTSVSISNTAPSSTKWNLILYEIKPATGSNTAARFVAAGAGTAGTTSLSVSYPAGVTTDDLLVLVVNHKGTGTPTVPSGWTTLFTQGYPSTAASLLGVYYRIHPSGGATSAISVTGLTSSASGFMLAFRNVDTTTPIAAAPGGYEVDANAAGTSGVTGGAITPVLGDVVLGVGGYAASGSLTFGNLTPDSTSFASGQSVSGAGGTTNSSFAAYQPYLRSGGASTVSGFTADHSVATDPANASALIVLRHGPATSGVTKTFESGTEQMVNWYSAPVATSTTQAYAGNQSLAATEGAANWGVEESSPGTSAVTAGISYTVSGWFRTSAGTESVTLQVQWINSSSAAVGTNFSTSGSASSTGWTKFSGTATAPSGAVTARFIISSTAGSNGRIMYIDNLNVT